MNDRLRFAAPKHAPAGLWRRVPPMIFAPILSLLALALAWRWGAEAFHLPLALPGFLDGLAVALFLFAALAYLRRLRAAPVSFSMNARRCPAASGWGLPRCRFICAAVFWRVTRRGWAARFWYWGSLRRSG